MFAVLTYIAAITAANLSVAWIGPWVSPINAFVLIGLDLSLRDRLHERWQANHLWPRMLAMILAGGAISYLLNPAAGKIAIASTAAFVVAGLADALAYHALRRWPYMTRANGSNVVGAAVDSLVFPTMAFGGLIPAIVLAQFAAKVTGGALWSVVLRRTM